MTPVNIKVVAQSVERAALKTFAQAFVGVLVVTFVPAMNQVVADVAQGKNATLDYHFYRNIGVAAVAAGISALISLAWNMLRDGTPVSVGGDATTVPAASAPVPTGTFVAPVQTVVKTPDQPPVVAPVPAPASTPNVSPPNTSA